MDKCHLEELLNVDLGAITIPTVECTFAGSTHPDSQLLTEMADSWVMSRFGNLPNGRGSYVPDVLLKADFSLLSCAAWANSKSNRVQPLFKLIIWLFMIDNILDDPKELGDHAADAAKMVESVMSVFESRQLLTTPLNVMAATALEWWSEMSEEMPRGQQARFINVMRAYLHANISQVALRHALRLPDLETYKQIRADASAMRVAHVAMEYAQGVEFDEETYNHPLLRALQDACSAHVYWINDLYSFKKEYMEGDLINIIPILCYNKLITIRSGPAAAAAPPSPLELMQEGALIVCRMIQYEDKESAHLINEIKQSSALMAKPGMLGYLDNVGFWMAGNLHWHLVSARYIR